MSSSLLCANPRRRVKNSMEKQREKQRNREELMMGDKITGKQCRVFNDSICTKYRTNWAVEDPNCIYARNKGYKWMKLLYMSTDSLWTTLTLIPCFYSFSCVIYS